MQGIEGVEEFFLGTLLLREELDVINQQNVDVAKLVAKAGHPVVTKGVDHLVGELFARNVADGRLRLAALYFVPDRLHEMRLAHTDPAIEKQRVVRLRGPLGYSLGGGVGKLVAGADDEGVKRVARVQLRRGV